jgi:uncharacterized protein (DUF2252 family)
MPSPFAAEIVLTDAERAELEGWTRRRTSAAGLALRESLETSRRVLVHRFRYTGMARKVVGVGSVGTRAWVVLLLGHDDQDPLLVQVKEAQPSVFERFLGSGGYANAAERVVAGE